VLAGHGEYDVDNFEFHTHFEGRHSHSHDVQGMSLVQMEQHGAGRLRRALEKLGYGVRKVTLGVEGAVPETCSCLIAMNPRTRFGPPEVQALEAWLLRGGSLLMLIEPDYSMDERLAALLARAGVGIGEGVVIDPTNHYYTDEQMIAITVYADHPATRGLALSFFPGARPVIPRAAPGVTAKALFSSSASSMVLPAGQHAERVRPRHFTGGVPAARSGVAGSLDAAAGAKAVPADRDRRCGLREQLVLPVSCQCRSRARRNCMVARRGARRRGEAAGRNAPDGGSDQSADAGNLRALRISLAGARHARRRGGLVGPEKVTRSLWLAASLAAAGTLLWLAFSGGTARDSRCNIRSRGGNAERRTA
jgi:hypothetical protein